MHKQMIAALAILLLTALVLVFNQGAGGRGQLDFLCRPGDQVRQACFIAVLRYQPAVKMSDVEFLNACKRVSPVRGRVWIITHDYPDPDALARRRPATAIAETLATPRTDHLSRRRILPGKP